MSTPISGSNNSAYSSAESKHLLDTYESGKDHPDDETNAQSMADLEKEGLRGAPDDAIQFETQQTLNRQKIEALPQKDRDRYTGMDGANITTYEFQQSADDRSKIAKSTAEQVSQPLAKQYGEIMADPLQRARLEFNAPFGEEYLGSDGQQKTATLHQLGEQFNQAKTPQERESLFAQAANIRHTEQLQVKDTIAQARTKVDQQWAKSDQELGTALDRAKALQIATQGDFDNGSSFDRLQNFAEHAFTSPENAQEFQYQAQHDPDKFKTIGDWTDDATKKSQWAHSDLEGRSPKKYNESLLPMIPYFTKLNLPSTDVQDYRKIGADDLQIGDFGKQLQDKYQSATKVGIAQHEMYHAASQKGEIRDEYLRTNTTPPPLWRQQLEDGAGRFAVGMIPGVNLLTPLIVPAKSLSSDVKNGIDLASGVLSGMLGAAKVPALENAGEADTDARGGNEPTGPAKSGAKDLNVKPTETRTFVPDAYASQPAGKLHADTNAQGIFTDENGQHFIKQNDNTWAVRYDRGRGAWQVYYPQNPTKPPYPVNLDNTGNWVLGTGGNLPGGNGSSFLTSLARFASNPRVARLLKDGMLKPQTPGTCYFDHSNVLRDAAGEPGSSIRPINGGNPLTRAQLDAALDKGPVLLSGRNVAQPDSGYEGMHTVALIDHVDVDGKKFVLGIDLDDTLTRPNNVGDPAKSDFGGVLYDPDKLVKTATPYVDPDTQHMLEMYQQVVPKGSSILNKFFGIANK